MKKMLMAWVLMALLVPLCFGETLLEQQLALYDGVKTVTCDVRREIDGPGGKSRMLSRVHFQKPNKIHVENTTPMRRRYIADGERMFYYMAGDPKGFSRPVAELDEDWLISLRKVPGTPMGILLTIQGAEELDLEGTSEYPVRKGYKSEAAYAVLSLDVAGRLTRVEFFRSPEMTHKTAQYDYAKFREYGKNLYIPLLHTATLYVGDVEKKEITRFTGMEVNTEIPSRLFVAEPFFEDVEFVDSFEKIYGGR